MPLHLVHHPGLTQNYMTFSQPLTKFLFKLLCSSLQIVQITGYIFHYTGNLHQLLCYCQPILDHTVIPHQVLSLFLKILCNCLIILYRTGTYACPVSTDSSDIFFIPALHGTHQCLYSFCQFLAVLSPADFSLIASAAYLCICVPDDPLNLPAAQIISPIWHPVESICQFLKRCRILLHSLFLRMALLQRQKLFCIRQIFC